MADVDGSPQLQHGAIALDAAREMVITPARATRARDASRRRRARRGDAMSSARREVETDAASRRGIDVNVVVLE